MSIKLFEITDEVIALEKMIDEYASEHEGEIPDFLNDEFDRLAGERNEKRLNIGAWIKGLEAEIQAHKDEQKRQGERVRVLSNKATSLKSLIGYNLAQGEKLNDTRCALSYRKSERVIVDVAPEDLPKDLATIIVTVTPDKKEIKARLKSDEGCEFAHMEENFSLQIK